MTVYIAFLRGINVGGHNKIKMADLKTTFESMGFNRVQTYIQSGNVLFEADEDIGSLRKRIEEEIESVFSISLTVVLRTSAELDDIITNCPFPEALLKQVEASTEVVTFYVSMLLERPSQRGMDHLSSFVTEIDDCRFRDRNVYLLLREGVLNSKLVANFAKLNVPSTMRNWKTMNKLHSLAKAME